VEAFGVLIKFKMALPSKLRYQNNAGGDVRYCFAMAILVIIIKILPFFYFHGNCGKICSTNSDFFLAYLVPLDVDVTGNITAKLCEVWSEFNIFCTLITMVTAASYYYYYSTHFCPFDFSDMP
jgi:hypothetical protein